MQLVDGEWRSNHPERARVAGSHGDATFAQRCADALLTLAKAKPSSSASNGKTVVLLNVNVETLEAEIVGHGPISNDELSECLARAEVYAAIKDMDDVTIRFGRSKRFGTALQKLLLAAQGGGMCWYPGCDRHWAHTRVHHKKRFEDGGCTDLENLALLCDQHHRHHHLVDERGIDRPLKTVFGFTLGRGPPWAEILRGGIADNKKLCAPSKCLALHVTRCSLITKYLPATVNPSQTRLETDVRTLTNGIHTPVTVSRQPSSEDADKLRSID
jgi:hypothetical protein